MKQARKQRPLWPRHQPLPPVSCFVCGLILASFNVSQTDASSPTCFWSSCFILTIETQSKAEIGTSAVGYWCERPEHGLGKERGRSLELWSRKAIECQELSGRLWRSLEDKKVENSAGLACEVAETLETPLGLLCEESAVSRSGRVCCD